MSVCPQELHVTITHDALDLTVYPPPLNMTLTPTQSSLLVTFGGQDRKPAQTCSLENFTIEAPNTSADIWWLANNEEHLVEKRAVRILLECFLGLTYIFIKLLHKTPDCHGLKVQTDTTFSRLLVLQPNGNI